MPITIKYFASLREAMGSSEQTLNDENIRTVADIMTQLPGLPGNTLVAVNQEYAGPDTEVTADDEIAFFPPVTGG